MADRPFRTERSQAAEAGRRDRVAPMLRSRGVTIGEGDDKRHRTGSATAQTIVAKLPDGRECRIRVRLCWDREGRSPRECSYAASQLAASLVDGDWTLTLRRLTERAAVNGITHHLFVQDMDGHIVLAALVPNDALADIWQAQREESSRLIGKVLTGRIRRNHAENGQSLTLYLQDDREMALVSMADVVWNWPGIIDILALPLTATGADLADTVNDLPVARDIGHDGVLRQSAITSGYPRDPRVRADVIRRSKGVCERPGCAANRDFDGFLDVHHIFGVARSDRHWTCVALCPNCHREAHFSQDRDELNRALAALAARFDI